MRQDIDRASNNDAENVERVPSSNLQQQQEELKQEEQKREEQKKQNEEAKIEVTRLEAEDKNDEIRVLNGRRVSPNRIRLKKDMEEAKYMPGLKRDERDEEEALSPLNT